MNKRTTRFDVFILSCFTILITFQPYFLHGKVNLFELGIYLPNIQGILDGQIPHRDFFHLRGAFELYPPAFLMSLFGENIAVLEAYFYFGTILTLILCVLLASQIYQTRLLLYLMVPVLVARTFPRVVFTYWGGMRFALGVLAILLAVQYFRRSKNIWLLWAGIVTGSAVFTSIEIGVCAFFGIAGALFLLFWFKASERRKCCLSGLIYVLGLLAVIVPYGLYLAFHQALLPYIDSVWTVVSNMQNVFNMHFASNIPDNIGEAFLSIINPGSKNFKHMTPAYLYIFLSGFFIYRFKKRSIERADFGILALGFYGVILYISAFRNIEAAQFEMALQPEKILLFYLLEEAYLFLRRKKAGIVEKMDVGALAIKVSSREWRKGFGINVLFVLLILSSLGYSIQRYNHRFFGFKYIRNKIMGKNISPLIPLHNRSHTMLEIDRVRGMVVPDEQAGDFQQAVQFIRGQTQPGEPVLLFPELGTYYFLLDRPFVGRFPMATFAWLNDQWHEEFLKDLHSIKPRFVITDRKLDSKFEKVYFRVSANRDKYNQVVEYIQKYYRPVKTTPSLQIYQRKGLDFNTFASPNL